MSRSAIVTGAAGQDGSYLVERLLQEGTTVHALVRSMDAAAALRDAGGDRRLHVHVFDIREADKMATLLREARPDEIFNLAGLSSVATSFDQPSETWQSNANAVVALNRTDFGGDSIALKEDGVHDRHQRSPKLASLSS